jgi:hypothetical protein
MESTNEVTCESNECAFKREEMKEYPTPCRHCLRNKKKEDAEGDFYIGKVNY